MIKQVFHGWLLDLDLLVWRDLLYPVFMRNLILFLPVFLLKDILPKDAT